MKDFFGYWGEVLQALLILPWQKIKDDDDDDEVLGHWVIWIVGWPVTFAGIIGTGVFAPYLVTAWHIPVAYQNYTVIGLAFIGGFLWQLFSLILITPAFSLDESSNQSILSGIALIFPIIISFTLPLGISGFLIYWYFSHFAPHHNLVGSGILGATLLKLAVSFGIPLVKSFFTGAALRWTLKKIRGNPPKRDTLTPIT